LKPQIQAKGGYGSTPLNCGAEIYDYVSITDPKESGPVTGNIGWIKRHYSVYGKGTWEMRFGFGGWANYQQFLNDIETNTDTG
jgi:hypothetical protein